MSNAVAQDPVHGYYHLDPIPDQEYIDNWYRDKYYGLIAAGGRAPELRRMLAGGETGARELEWLKKTLWEDIVHVVGNQFSGRGSLKVLDFGCGPGQFMQYCRDNTKWDLQGTEPADDARASAIQSGLTVHRSLDEAEGPFDVAISLNVFEHLPDPIFWLGQVASRMAPGGIIGIRVPNDFSPLQDAAHQKLAGPRWWIAYPDHINYFTFGPLRSVFNACGFDVVDEFGDFPMELFLLFGDDYVSDPKLGGVCHQKRSNFEMSIPGELRRKMYRSFAANGLGRNALVFARKRK